MQTKREGERTQKYLIEVFFQHQNTEQSCDGKALSGILENWACWNAIM